MGNTKMESGIVLTPLLSSAIRDNNYNKNFLNSNYQAILSCLLRCCYEKDKNYTKELIRNRANIYNIFDSLQIEELVFVQKNHMLIGFFTYSLDGDKLEVRFYESPHTCKVAIMNLIQAAVFYLKFTTLIFNSIVFYSYQRVIKFILQGIFSDITFDEVDNLYVMYTTQKELSDEDLDKINTINTYRVEKI